jgi:hypothetical protein
MYIYILYIYIYIYIKYVCMGLSVWYQEICDAADSGEQVLSLLALLVRSTNTDIYGAVGHRFAECSASVFVLLY